MVEYPWIPCSFRSSEYSWFVILAATSLVVYTLGIPLLAASLLVWKRFAIMEGNEEVEHWLGSLYEGYKPQIFWWELVCIVRRWPSQSF
jgi:hypothetical protein